MKRIAIERRLWTGEELIQALNLYLKLPFGKRCYKTSKIIHRSQIPDHTPNSVAMRLSDFASVDPFNKERGTKQVVPIFGQLKSSFL